jgi:hypothetical protein
MFGQVSDFQVSVSDMPTFKGMGILYGVYRNVIGTGKA